MIIKELIRGKFVNRPNRFTIEFIHNNTLELAHLHDPGRLKELLIKNVEILVKFVPTFKKTGRKTRYDVIAVKYNQEWVLINSGYHNNLVEELIHDRKIKKLEDFHIAKREYTVGSSRLDFLLENDFGEKMYLEVKGCTLVEDKIAKFPDAPTKRGSKHVNELTALKLEGKLAGIVILVLQNSVDYFTPNKTTDPEFSNCLKKAYDVDVQVFPTHINTCLENNNLILTFKDMLPIKF